MPKKYKSKSPDQHIAGIKAVIKQLPLQVGSEAAAQFQKNFDRQRFFSGEAWIDRNGGNKGRAILIGSGSGILRGAIDFASEVSRARVFVNGLADKYAGIHNNGGVITVNVTPKMKRWAWAMFKRTGETMYRAIALTKKKTFLIKIPKRQFIGNHPDLDTHLLKFIETILSKSVK